MVPPSGPAMLETMSARIYGEHLVIITDEWNGMYAFAANASGLLGDDPAALVWAPGQILNEQAGLNSSFVNVALRILPVDSATPTHAALGWHDVGQSQCKGGMTF